MKRLGVMLSVFAAILCLSACTNQLTPAKIAKAKVMTFGVKTDVPKFSYRDPQTNDYAGFEIELSQMIAKEFGATAEFVPVTTLTREKVLQNEKVDAVIATYTISKAREKEVHFSAPYFTGYLAFLVQNDAPYQKIDDLKGKLVGVVYGSTAGTDLPKFSKKYNLSLEATDMLDYASVRYALAKGQVDAFAADKIILNGYDDDGSRILPGGFSPQHYGVAVKKENTDLLKAIDKLLSGWEKDGTMAKLYQEYNLTNWSDDNPNFQD
jgi:putative glutamine transport system substrate-binding protein